jgi:hypothetical protein
VSPIDSSLDPALRALMLSEVKSLLPAFLSAAVIERGGPVNAAVELLGLPESDLRRVLAVHAMLSAPVRELVAELPAGARSPLTSSARPRVAGRTVASGIDWAATTRHRATSSPLGDIWVTRAAKRIFDIPENRALAWVLQTLEERGTIAVPAIGEAPGAWGGEIRSMTGVVRRARRTAWLEGVPALWPGDEAYFRLKADRKGFYRTRVTNAARYLRRILLAPSAEDVVQALSDRFFEPRQDWKLFEIAVLMRITHALAEIGTRLDPTRLFIEGRGRPFARFRFTPAREVRLWYQMWPPATRPSELDGAVRYYELTSGGNRPDIVIESVDDGASTRAIVLELKASASPAYLSSGLSQLLGYLRDRPRLLAEPASGWLVVPAGPGYSSKPPGGRALWVTSADDVAAAVRSVASTDSAQ